MRRVLLATTLAGLLSTLAPAIVHASAQSVIRDCTDNGRIDSSHTQSDYKGALSGLPSDVDEYTDCRSIIRSAQQRDASRGGSTTGGTGSTGSFGTSGSIGGGFGFPPSGTAPGGTPLPAATPAETAAQAAATAAGAGPVPIAGAPITPGASGLGKGVGNHTLPGSLLVVLLAAGLAALAGGIGSRRRGGDDPAGPSASTGGGDPIAVPDAGAPKRGLPSLRGVMDRVFPRRA
jgi:hypothetical protein